MQYLQVVCPSGLFILPERHSVNKIAWECGDGTHELQHQLLGQLQVLTERTRKQLAILSICRSQAAPSWDVELQALLTDIAVILQQTLQHASTATQPLLLTSSQHTSCFCQLLEQAHLLDVLRHTVLAEQNAITTNQDTQEQEVPQPQQQHGHQEQHSSFIILLAQQLQSVQGIDSVLAALIGHCQQVFAAGSKQSREFARVTNNGKPEAIDVACLNSIQEQHSAARALPLLLRLYFTSSSRNETIATGKPECLAGKLLERCLTLLAAKPVIPGYGDMHVCLSSLLEDCQPLQEALAARKLKLPVSPKLLDYKSASKIDHTYSIQSKVQPLLQQHDELCDLLSQLALEVKQALAVDRDVDPKAFIDAENLVVNSIEFVSAAKNTLLELDAWRLEHNSKSKRWLQKQLADARVDQSCNRFALKDEDVVPFMDVLGAAKGLSSLVQGTNSWLQQLLQVHSLKQLQEIATSTLPALSRLYPRNKRVRALLRQIYATVQGHLVEMKDETYMPSYATSNAGDVAMTPPISSPTPRTPTGADEQLQPQQQEQNRRQSGPIAEGKEGSGLLKHLGNKLSPFKDRTQRRHSHEQEQHQQQHESQSNECQQLPLEHLAIAEQSSIQDAAAEALAAAAAAAASAIAEQAKAAAADPPDAEQYHTTIMEQGGSSAASTIVPALAVMGEAANSNTSVLQAYAAAAAAEAQQTDNPPSKKGLLKKLKKSIRGSSKKGRPQPSPAPELCAAPAAFAAQARAEYEALLSEVAAEASIGKLPEAAAAAAEAEIAAAAATNESWVSAAEPAPVQLLRTHLLLPGDEDTSGSFAQLKGEGGTASPSLGSLASLNTAFDRPPDLPWESSADGVASTTALVFGQEQSPRSVAMAAAAFESKIAANRRLSRLSSTACNSNTSPAEHSSAGGVGAIELPKLVLPDASDMLETDDPVEAAVTLQLAQTTDGPAVDANGNPVPCSPQSARRLHLFKFHSILQHHEKLSSGAVDASLPAAALSKVPSVTAEEPAALEQGRGARLMAALSIKRRTTAASAVSAASAAVEELEASVAAGDLTDATAASDATAVLQSSEIAMQAAVTENADAPGLQSATREDGADVPACRAGSIDVVDQPSKQGRVGSIMSRVFSRTLTATKEPPAAVIPSSAQHQSRSTFKALNFTAKLRKAMSDKKQASVVDDTLLNGLPQLQLEGLPSMACLVQLRVLLEQLMHEIKAETKKHLVMQLQLAAAAAASSASAKPDASIARPLRQVKAMIKAVHRIQQVLDWPQQLAAAADLSSLWISKENSSCFAAEQQRPANSILAAGQAGLTPEVIAQQQAQSPTAVQNTKVLYNLLYEESSDGSGSRASPTPDTRQLSQISITLVDNTEQPVSAARTQHQTPAEYSSFPAALLASCMKQLCKLPAELPLLVMHLFWDAASLLQRCELLQRGSHMLKQQEEDCMSCYMSYIVPAAYEHFKKIAAHQTVTHELLSMCGARNLEPVQSMYLDALLREPCLVVLQGNYAAMTQAAEAELLQAGAVLKVLVGRKATRKAASPCATEQQIEAQHQVQQIQDALHDACGQEGYDPNLVLPYNISTAGHCSAASSPGKASGKHQSKKRNNRKRRAAGDDKEELPVAAAAAGQTPLMQKLEQLKLEQQLLLLQENQALVNAIDKGGSCVVDVRQWLLAGLLRLLRQDVCAVVSCCRSSSPGAIVQVQTQAAILQRTHQLLAQYVSLPYSWPQIWEAADVPDSTGKDERSCPSATAHAVAAGILAMLDTAVYDSEAQVLLPVAVATDGRIALGSEQAFAGVMSEIAAALQPMSTFFGRQHLQALLGLAGPAGQHHLIDQLLQKLDQEQNLLLDQLQQLQQQLPGSMLKLPPAETCHNAGAVLQFYQQQLSMALTDPGGCAAALGSLQRIGNCLALLHLMSVQQSVQATPEFMQAAPLLGIVGQPLSEAAAAAECFENEQEPQPPAVYAATDGVISKSCAAGLLMPEIEQLMATEGALKIHEMQDHKELLWEQEEREAAAAMGQPFDESLIKPGGDLRRHRIWQASHFQRLILGPDADKVRGPALLLTQNAELRAWRATEAMEYMGPCMQRVRLWATKLQRALQGLAGEAAQEESDATNGPSSCSELEHQQQCSSDTANGALEQVCLQSEALARQDAAADFVAQVTVLQQPPQQQAAAAAEQQQTALQMAEDREQCVNATPHTAASNGLTKGDSPYKDAAGEVAVHHHVSYDEQDDSLPTPPGLQLDHVPAVAEATQPNVFAVAATAGLALKPSAVSSALSAELAVAAKVAADAAASVPNSPRAVAAVAAASAPSSPRAGAAAAGGNGVSIWEAAGAAAAQISAGSVAPSLAKLAFKALPNSGAEAPESACTERVLSAGSRSKYGLAALVEEVSDVISSARSDAQAEVAVMQPNSDEPEGPTTAAALTGNDAHSGGSTAAGTSASADSAAAAPSAVQAPGSVGTSPGRAAVPRLNLSPGGTTVLAAGTSDAAHISCAAESKSDASAVPQSAHAQLSSRTACKAGSEGGTDIDGEGSYPAPDVNNELYDSTCTELVRVKDENNLLRSEVEFLRNQLHNRETTVALLSGNLYTPRQSDRGAVSSAAEGALQETACQPLSTRASTSSSTSSTQQLETDGATDTVAADAKADNVLSVVESEGVTISATTADVAVSIAAEPNKAVGNVVQQQVSTTAGAPAATDVQEHRPEVLQPVLAAGLGMSAGLIKGPVGAGLSPEPSDIRPESSKVSVRAQQPSPQPPVSMESEASSDDDDSSDSSSSAGDSLADVSNSATRKLKLPAAVRPAGGSHSAELAAALSALKFALLLDVAQTQTGGACISSVSAVGLQAATTTPQASPLKKLKKASLSTFSAAPAYASGSSTAVAAAAEQPIRPGCIAAADIGSGADSSTQHAAGIEDAQNDTSTAAIAATNPARGNTAVVQQQQHPLGSGRIAGGQYGDGPLLASAVLLQLTGQVRKHALIDATNRVAHWVEYDAVKNSGPEVDADATAVTQAGMQAPGGVAPSAAEGVMQPKPSSKKRQEEEAEEQARLEQQEAAQQLLLQRLAAAARQAERVAQDGCSLAERFAPQAPAHRQKVMVKVHRVDGITLAAQHGTPAGTTERNTSTSKHSSLGGSVSQAGSALAKQHCMQDQYVLAVPVRPHIIEYTPYVRPWTGLTPSQQPIQTHPALPMPRPRPLLLPNNRTDNAAAAVEGGAQRAAGAAGGIVGPAGRLLPGVGVNANAGLVAAARAVHAREALLAAMPRTAVYSFSVMSDHNRSGMMDDGYSKAPSVPDYDSVEDSSPRKGKHHNPAAAASAARLGGRLPGGMSDLAGGQVQGDQRMHALSDCQSSPSKAPTRSPSKRANTITQAGSLLASLVG